MALLLKSAPPQMIISVPVQIPLWANRAVGALVVVVAVQLSVVGLYLPPVFNGADPEPLSLVPPHTIISLPVQTEAA